jgi:hypothetical protein
LSCREKVTRFFPTLTSGLWVLFFLASAHPARGQDHLNLTPSISVSETYDDNIDLTPTNKNSDFITTIMPSLTVAYLKEKTKLDLN